MSSVSLYLGRNIFPIRAPSHNLAKTTLQPLYGPRHIERELLCCRNLGIVWDFLQGKRACMPAEKYQGSHTHEADYYEWKGGGSFNDG